MAASGEPTAAELLSKFFDDIEAAEKPFSSTGKEGSEVARICPAQDGVADPLPGGPEAAAGRELPQKALAGAGPPGPRGQDISRASGVGSTPAPKPSTRGGAAALRNFRPGILCRVGGKASPLWASSLIEAGEEPTAAVLDGRSACAGRPARPTAEAWEAEPLARILDDVDQWLLAGEQAALQTKTAAAGTVSASGGAPPAGFSDHCGAFRPMGEGRAHIYQKDVYSRQQQEEVDATAERHLARRGRQPGGGGPGGGDGDDGEGGAGKKGRGSSEFPMPRKVVLGGPLLPQEMKPMLTHIHGMSYLTAMQFSTFHSWQSHFGIMGPDAEEGEDPRVRGLVSTSTPCILLCELNAIASFNMMDPILSYNYEFLMDAARLMHKRTPHGNGGMPGSNPLGYIVQGAGPHLCPGGNHHPVSPPGGTPCSMHINTSSNPFIGNRECNLPSFTAMTGSVIGGGVALSLQQTHRVAAASCSMAFGNISRGACPVMFLSRNLPASVGLLGAVEIYLTDGTYSACRGQRVGMVHNVLPSFVAVKTQAVRIVKRMAATPILRLVNNVRNPMEYSQYQREAMGMTLAMRTGRLFANVKSARWRAPPEEAEPPGEEQEAGPSGVECMASATAPTSEVRAGSEACTQCGQRGAGGVRHGEAFFCAACWPRLGVPTSTGTRSPQPAQKVMEMAACAECGGLAPGRRSGMDGLWYCSPCWSRWQIKAGHRAGDGCAEVPTDVGSTDHTDVDSGSEDTIINSDCVSCSDVWSDSED